MAGHGGWEGGRAQRSAGCEPGPDIIVGRSDPKVLPLPQSARESKQHGPASLRRKKPGLVPACRACGARSQAGRRARVEPAAQGASQDSGRPEAPTEHNSFLLEPPAGPRSTLRATALASIAGARCARAPSAQEGDTCWSGGRPAPFERLRRDRANARAARKARQRKLPATCGRGQRRMRARGTPSPARPFQIPPFCFRGHARVVCAPL